jgi:hypothetical protein
MTVKESLLYTSKTDDRGRMRAVANNLILHFWEAYLRSWP